jgi:rod shape-determining protein MreC
MFRRHFSFFLLLLYTLLGLACLSWSADNAVRALRYTFHYLTFPAVEPPLALMERLGDFGRGLSRLVDLDWTFRSLEERGLLSRLERRRVEAAEEENRRLTALMGIAPEPGFTPLVARVWARENAGGFYTLIIRRGARDGVRAADPVMVLQDGREAVLGQVAEVYAETSRVMLLMDPSSAVSALAPRTGEQGAVEGAGPSRLLLNYLYSDTEVRPGDEVVTAGLGEVFPRGLLLGIVEAMESPPGETFHRALIRPAASAARASEVVVLLRRPHEGKKP